MPEPQVESSALIWKDPPPQRATRLAAVSAQLQARPGQWALIASETGLGIMPWWGPLHESDEYETRFVWKQPGALFGPRDIYARYISLPRPPARGTSRNERS